MFQCCLQDFSRENQVRKIAWNVHSHLIIELFEIFYGRLKSAPLIKACPVNVECRLAETVELPTNYVIIGEVVGVHAEESLLKDGHPDTEKIKPFVLSMPDNRFWSLGECVGRAWHEGKKFKT